MKPETPRLGPGNKGIEPSPASNDPHSSREETSAPTSPEEPPQKDGGKPKGKGEGSKTGPEADR